MRQDNAEGSSSSASVLSLRQQEVLVGTLLGDGCLAKHGYYHRLHIKHAAAQRALVNFKYEVFRDLISMRQHEFDQQLKGRTYPCVQFATRTSPALSEWHARFYRDGRKVVPADIARYLSPLAVSIWLMDDGAADFAGVTFQTHSFRADELELLRGALNQNFEVATTCRKNKGGMVLYVGAGQLSRLRALVEPHLLPEFEYKLKPRGLEPRRDCTLAPDESRGDDTVRSRWQQREARQKWEPAKISLGQYSGNSEESNSRVDTLVVPAVNDGC